MFICFGVNDENDMLSGNVSVGRGETVQEAISNWSGNTNILAYLLDYQEWCPTIIKGEEIQIDFDFEPNIQIIETE